MPSNVPFSENQILLQRYQLHTAMLSKFRRECVQISAFVIKEGKRFVTLAFDEVSHCLQQLLILEG